MFTSTGRSSIRHPTSFSTSFLFTPSSRRASKTRACPADPRMTADLQTSQQVNGEPGKSTGGLKSSALQHWKVLEFRGHPHRPSQLPPERSLPVLISPGPVPRSYLRWLRSPESTSIMSSEGPPVPGSACLISEYPDPAETEAALLTGADSALVLSI